MKSKQTSGSRSVEQSFNPLFFDVADMFDRDSLVIFNHLSKRPHPSSNLASAIEHFLDLHHDVPCQPLIIVENPFVPTKAALAEWYRLSNSNSKGSSEDLILFQFGSMGGPNQSLSNIFYQLLLQLKEKLLLTKQIQIHPEKVRTNLSYWLQHVNQALSHQGLLDTHTEYRSVVIVIEDITSMMNRVTQELQFWLPRVFPERVKLLMTMQEQSVQRLRVEGWKVRITAESVPSLIESAFQHKFNLYSSHRLQASIQALYLKLNSAYPIQLLLSFLFPNDFVKEARLLLELIAPEDILSLDSVQSIMRLAVRMWSGTEQGYERVLGLLVTTFKGLTQHQLKTISRCSDHDLHLLQRVFQPIIIITSKKQIMIKNTSFRRVLAPSATHAALIRHFMRKISNSLRKLEEVCYLAFTWGCFSQLKEHLTKIQNFLILYNPHSKFMLYQYWQALCKRLNIDVVHEFNKSLQTFKNDFLPNQIDLFKILVEISRFLKDFSSFQDTPNHLFLHPRLVSRNEQIGQLNIWNQFQDNHLVLFAVQSSQHSESKSVAQKISQRVSMLDHPNRSKLRKTRQKIMHKNVTTLKHIMESVIQAFKLSNIETVQGQTTFRNGYLNVIKRSLEKYRMGSQEGQVYRFPLNFNINEIIRLQERNDVSRQFYNYRRWIWIQFPWMSLNIQTNFNQAMSTHHKYKTVKALKDDYSKTMKIAVQAKHKRIMIMENKLDELGHLLKGSKSQKGPVRISQNTMAERSQQLLDIFLNKDMNRSSKKTKSRSIDNKISQLNQFFLTSEHRDLLSIHTSNKVLSVPPKSSLVHPRFRSIQSNERVQNYVQSLRRQLDSITHINKQLQNMIVNERRNKMIEIVKQEDAIKRSLVKKISKMLEVLDKQRYKLAYSDIRLDRIKKIKFNCQINQNCHKEWLAILTDLNNNLKKMIKHQLNQKPIKSVPRAELPKEEKRAFEAREVCVQEKEVSLRAEEDKCEKEQRGKLISNLQDFFISAIEDKRPYTLQIKAALQYCFSNSLSRIPHSDAYRLLKHGLVLRLSYLTRLAHLNFQLHEVTLRRDQVQTQLKKEISAEECEQAEQQQFSCVQLKAKTAKLQGLRLQCQNFDKRMVQSLGTQLHPQAQTLNFHSHRRSGF